MRKKAILSSKINSKLKSYSMTFFFAIVIVVIGLLFELFLGHVSLNSKNDKTDMALDLMKAQSNQVEFTLSGLDTKEDSANIKYDVAGKYIDDLAIGIANGRGTEVDVYADDQKVERLNYWDHDSATATSTIVPVVYHIDKEVNTITIIPKLSGTGIFNVTILNHYVYNFTRGIFFAGILLILYFMILMYIKKKVTVERTFLLLALVIGTIMSLTLPEKTGVSWDDGIHYGRSVHLFQFDSAKATVDESLFYQGMIPNTYSLHEREMLDRYLLNKNVPITGTINERTNLYASIAYIPSSVMLNLGGLLQLPYNIIYLLGRLINVFLYAFIISIGIKKLKSGKVIMAIVGLFPTSLFLASSYNYDSWIIAFAMLGCSLIFAELQKPDKKISRKEWIIILSVFMIGLAPKAVYFPIMALLILLNKNKFDTVDEYKKFRLASILTLVFIIGSFLLPFVFGGPGNGDLRGGTNVNATEQVKFILTNPFQYTKTLFTFLISIISLSKLPEYSTFFAYMGYINNSMLFIVTLAIAMFTDKSESDIYITKWKVRATTVFLYISSLILVSTALYVTYTAVASTTIDGVTLRYLLPVTYPMIAVFGSCKIRNKIKYELYTYVMLVIPTFVSFKGIWDVCISKYYL